MNSSNITYFNISVTCTAVARCSPQSYQPHDLLLLKFLLLLSVHHGLDDLPFLGGEMRQVRHLGGHSQYPTPAHGTKKCHHPAQRRCYVRRPVRRNSGHGQPINASRSAIPRSSRRGRRCCGRDVDDDDDTMAPPRRRCCGAIGRRRRRCRTCPVAVVRETRDSTVRAAVGSRLQGAVGRYATGAWIDRWRRRASKMGRWTRRRRTPEHFLSERRQHQAATTV